MNWNKQARRMFMVSLWSMSTTVRESDRIYGFLSVAKKIEGEVWDTITQKKYQVLLVQYREYLNDPSNGQTFQRLNHEQIEWLSNKDRKMPYEVAESIIDAKAYVGGAEMRGRQSMAPLKKLGLVYMDNSNRIAISDLGNKFINNEITFEEFFLDSLLKIQYPNPLDDSYTTWNTKPFISTLHLIRRVNELCELNGQKAKGISKDEFGIFALSLKNYYDVDKYANLIIDYRNQYETILDELEKKSFRESYISSLLPNFKEPITNSIEYTDNMIRYFRQTKMIHIRGKYANTYIDLEPRRKTEIESILAIDNGKPLDFPNAEAWLEYFSVYGTYVLPYENIEKLKKILDEINAEIRQLSFDNGVSYEPIVYHGNDKTQFKEHIQKAREVRTFLQNLQLKKEYFDITKIDEVIKSLTLIYQRDRERLLVNKPSLEFEKWMNVALNIFNDAHLIKPNTIVGDDNEPINTAPGGVADIECYYETYNAICEVTTLTSRDQWINEGQPVMRHLREFEVSSDKEQNYCIFVAPKLHQDTVNTFWNSVKYEYEGVRQRIVPITIPQLILLLEGVKKVHSKNKKLDHKIFGELLHKCSDTTGIKSSREWIPNVQRNIGDWVSTL